MFKCPSRLKQRRATCLIQSRCSLCVVCCNCMGGGGDKKPATHPPFTHPHVPTLPPSTHPIITLHAFLHKVMRVSGRFITLHESGGGNVTWVPCFWGHSLSSSRGATAVLVNPEPDERNFTSARAGYYPQPGIITYIGYTVPLSSSTLYIIGSDQPIYTSGIWQEMSEHSGVNMCACVCGKTEQEGSWGIQSLTQRSKDRREDTLQAQNNPGSIHEWNDRITGVLENLLRWLIMLFMAGRHAAWREKVKLFD